MITLMVWVLFGFLSGVLIVRSGAFGGLAGWWLRTHRRTIYDDRPGGSGSPYLTRYYIWGRPKMPDGSCPFDSQGRVREGAAWGSGWGFYIHCFHRSDSATELHSHPWKWALSFILSGGYWEERRKRLGDAVVGRHVGAGALNLLRSDTFHRVDLYSDTRDGAWREKSWPTRECWSLFLTGPKSTSWGFWDRRTKAFKPWREFLEIPNTMPEDY